MSSKMHVAQKASRQTAPRKGFIVPDETCPEENSPLSVARKPVTVRKEGFMKSDSPIVRNNKSQTPKNRNGVDTMETIESVFQSKANEGNVTKVWWEDRGRASTVESNELLRIPYNTDSDPFRCDDTYSASDEEDSLLPTLEEFLWGEFYNGSCLQPVDSLPETCVMLSDDIYQAVEKGGKLKSIVNS
jgi:hypothetical protein